MGFKCIMKQFLYIGCCIFVLVPSVFAILGNPYSILGVKQAATISEIKKAYKALAREWHPDKNNNPEAENKFVEINQAYELLSDPERRNLYDKHGVTEDTPNFRHKADYSQFRRFDSFDDFFGSGSFKFESESSIYRKQSITESAYYNNVLPKSTQQPFLIFFYSDMCLPCMQASFLWKKLVDEMEPLGVGFATVHANWERSLSQKLGVSTLPYLVLVLDNRVFHYKEYQLGLIKIAEWVRGKFPYRTVTEVESEAAADDFLAGWIDNRVRVLLFGRREVPRLRYLLAAFQFRSHAAFGYVRMGPEAVEKLVNRYRVAVDGRETLLVFNEDGDSPVASLSAQDISASTLREMITANKYLLLPRLSSQNMFDQLCPPEASRLRKRLCVVLVIQNIPAHQPYCQAMREYLRQYPPANKRVKFVYMFSERQTSFVSALAPDNTSSVGPGLVVLWRRNHDLVQYQWLEENWVVLSPSVNVSVEVLHEAVDTLLHSKEFISTDATVQTLVDEHAMSIFSRIILKMVSMTQYLKENITREEALPAISVILTILFVVAGGYFMSYLVKMEEEVIGEKYRREGRPPPVFPQKVAKIDVPLNVHEMRGETYNGLVRLLKPGCRTIVLLLDAEAKPKLLPVFYRTCNPYRRNKSLMFAFLMLDKNVEWYRRLLVQTLAERRELNIVTKNCIGTVLSLNGHRKYFCMYHAKYQENIRTDFLTKRKTTNGGDFIGFGDTSDSSETETSDIEGGPKLEDPNTPRAPSVSQEQLLDGLSNWLDRLFEGSTQRYYIKFWPNLK